MERAIALTGGRTTTGVVRIGNTVHRPISARAAFVHEVLRHLGAREFGGALCLLNSETSQIHNWSQLRACCVNCMTKPSIAR